MENLFEKQGYVKDHKWFSNPTYPLLKHIILLGVNRKLIIKAKFFFRKAIELYARAMPEPTRDNCLKVNSHNWLDIRDEFFRRHPVVPKRGMIESAFKIIIDEIEHNEEYDPLYNDLMELMKSKEWFNSGGNHAGT